jgi:hypothetical protein
VNRTDTSKRLAKLRSEFTRLKAPNPQELAMSANEVKALLGEIKRDGRALIDQLQVLSKAGQEQGLVNDVINSLERTLGQVKSQDTR